METTLTTTSTSMNNGLVAPKLTRDQVDLIKRTCAKEASDDELALFINYCNNKVVNPLSKEIYFTKYNGQVNFLTSYHFMLAKVQETGLFEGMTLPLFCSEDGNWQELWTKKVLPVACKVGVFRKGYREAVYSIRYTEETQQSNPQWKKQPLQMLRKATIADALRLAFDDVLRGILTQDEMPVAITATAEMPVAITATTDNLPDISKEDWDWSIIPNYCLPDEFKNQNMTFRDLASDYNEKTTYISKETGNPCQIRHVLHRWQTASKFSVVPGLKEIAKALLEKYPSKKEQKEDEETPKEVVTSN